MSEPLLELENVTKKYGSITAVDDVSFTLDGKGITGLIGPNGAGKTTLFNTISGKFPPTEGEIRFDGKTITDLSSTAVIDQGLGRSFQITNIFEGLTVRENLRAPVIARTGARFNPFDRAKSNEETNAETDRIIELIGLEDVADRNCENLSYGEKRRVELGIGFATDPKLMLLDEPTAGMTTQETAELIDLIEEINESTDMDFLIVEHDMNVIFSVAERILVLNGGSILAEGTAEEIKNNDAVQQAYLGDRDSDVRVVDHDEDQPTRERLLDVSDIHTYYGQSHVIHGTSLHVNEGEVIALLGRNGAGKTTTLRSIMGLSSPRQGEITFRDERIENKEPFEISRAGIGYVPEERDVFTGLTVDANLEIMMADDSRWTKERIYEEFPALDKRRNMKSGQMSGGEQQMLAIARALVTDPELLILDEPSEGLAPVIVDDLEEILLDIAEQGLSVLLTEQNTSFAAAVSERSYVMDKGEIAWHGTTEELMADESIINRYLTLEDVQTK
jgi:ABC-type branched-subunit amino acid transport system ATPase component